MIDFDNDITITTNRSCIWNKAHCWYKAAQVNPSRLKMNLMVESAWEAGLDAGALHNEFFTSLLQHINAEFFEGREERWIPKHEWEMERWFEMVGTMIAHSVLLGGPGFPCIHPAMFEWMVDPSKELVEDLPTVEDIPLNAANMDLIDLISKVRSNNIFTIILLKISPLPL